MVPILILPCLNIFIRFGRKSLAQYWARPGWLYLVFMAMLMLIGCPATHVLRYNSRNQIEKLYTRFNSSCVCDLWYVVCGMCILYNYRNGVRQLKFSLLFFSTLCIYDMQFMLSVIGWARILYGYEFPIPHHAIQLVFPITHNPLTVSIPYFKL